MKECIVIGAGPGGIVTIKELLENGINNILCIEKSDRLGGVFARGYENLQLTSSATFSMFSDYLNKDDEDNHFWSKDEAVDYWNRYAEKFNVKKNIKFNTEVIKVNLKKNGTWELVLDSKETLHCKHLVLATGNNSFARYPHWADQLTKIKYSHSQDFQNADSFKDKNVLVVGGGESASDMALEISKTAKQCYVSLRESTGWVVPRKRGKYAADISTHRGLWGLPREYGESLSKYLLTLEKTKKDPVTDAVVMLNSLIPNPKGIWGTYGTKTTALAEAIAYHNCKVVGEVAEVKNGGCQLVIKDKTVLDNIDAVVFSTGYENKIPFMPDDMQVSDPRSLYKHMFHINYGKKLTWIGWARPGFGSQFPIMEMQARYYALVCSKKVSLPRLQSMKKTIAADYHQDISQFEENAERIRSLVDYFRYMDSMAKIIGCQPPLLKYFFVHPIIWLHLVYGPSQATQYRLVGPGSKAELAHNILKKLPVSKFNNVVKAGLRGRLYYTLGWGAK